jgi:hypothetical protein
MYLRIYVPCVLGFINFYINSDFSRIENYYFYCYINIYNYFLVMKHYSFFNIHISSKSRYLL